MTDTATAVSAAPLVAPVLAAVPPTRIAVPKILSTEDVQAALNRLGASPPLLVDNDLGDKTKAAIRAFQTAHPPLAVDGFAGLDTCAAIEAALAAH